MNLLPLAQLLETDGLGVQGKSIFVNMIPESAPRGILLRNKLQGTVINYELPGYYKAKFQIIVRSSSYADGEALMAQALVALTVANTQVGPLFMRYMRPHTQSVVYPLSKGNLLEFALDFDAVFNQ
jgi:hypothetical protein